MGLLIFSSALIERDGDSFFSAAGSSRGKTFGPFLGLATLLVTRQVMQALCSLPPAVRNHLALFPAFPFAPGHLWRGETISSSAAHGPSRFFGATDTSRDSGKKWLTRACCGRSDFRKSPAWYLVSASTLHHGCVRWNIRRTVGLAHLWRGEFSEAECSRRMASRAARAEAVPRMCYHRFSLCGKLRSLPVCIPPK